MIEYIDIETGEIFILKIIPFGKYKFLTVADIKDRSYIKWLYTLDNLDIYLKEDIEMIYTK